MPKFKVMKGQDAYVIYETIVEADTAADAIFAADDALYDGTWVRTDEVREYDASTILEDEVFELADPDGTEPT